MEFVRVVLSSWFLVLWILGCFGKMVVASDEPCNFPAIYNFGDSNSDTGGISAAFLPVPPPNGETFFGKPSGRACDGRLLIDFMAENLKLPYLSAYLNSVGTNFRTGANFATGGSTIRPQNGTLFEGGVSPFSLNVQLWQFEQFKNRISELYKQVKDPSYLPNPGDFSKALYILDIGQNDLAAGFRTMTDAQIRASIPDIVDQLVKAVQKLYLLGAQTFWIHNTGPIGCLPTSRFYFSSEPALLDPNGCIKSHNEIAREFNKQLKGRIVTMRSDLVYASITYVDIYASKYELITGAKSQGFVDPLQICCGKHESYHVWCGQKMTINTTEVSGAACGNPANYISWDGVHYSEAANQWVANNILSGQRSNPPLPLAKACRKLGGY